ncbi:UNVERIFIED_ORG: Tfp pilus assembly protein PilE [Arthrobacter globiformis]|nr:Tfp pilus assembly protein PilE [Arthrobacter globiformis]
MTDSEAVTLETQLDDEEANSDIAKAVSARHSIARKYVMRIRRRRPEATPAEVIKLLERHYSTSITAAGAAITAGSIAAEVGIAFIPGGGVAAAGLKTAGKQAAKKTVQVTAKEAAKVAAKNMAMGAAKNGAQRVAALLPAGDQQLQFELTAIFGLALADIHGMDLDQDQAHALVYGLTNDRVSQEQIATMAKDVAKTSPEGVVGVGHKFAAAGGDWSHWATTLADTLPSGAAQSLVRTIQTGQLDTVRETLSGKQQSAVEYGVGALTGGVSRFVFGRDVVLAARTAFPEVPAEFPEHLALQDKTSDADDRESEPNRALAALEDAAKSTGSWITDTASTVGEGVATGASAVGSGVASAAAAVSRPFRAVDVDGDGIPDEPQALAAVKGLGGALAGASGAASGRVAGLFKSRKRDTADAPERAPEE